jgi:hypothetical protein
MLSRLSVGRLGVEVHVDLDRLRQAGDRQRRQGQADGLAVCPANIDARGTTTWQLVSQALT